jgi:hypothetical protein
MSSCKFLTEGGSVFLSQLIDFLAPYHYARSGFGDEVSRIPLCDGLDNYDGDVGVAVLAPPYAEPPVLLCDFLFPFLS